MSHHGPQPPAYGPPPPHHIPPQWTPPPPPPRRPNRTVLWLSLGSAGVVVLIMFVLVGLYVSGILGPGTFGDGGETDSSAQPPQTNFTLVADLCSRVDYSALDSFGKHSDRDDEASADEGPTGVVSCPQTFVADGSPQGTLYVTAYYETDALTADQWWRERVGDVNEKADDSETDVEGIGESTGHTAYGADQGEQDWYVLTLHGNLVVDVWFAWWAEPAAEAETAAMMLEFAKGVQALAEGG